MKTVHLVDPELRPLLALMPERILEASVLPAMREERQRATAHCKILQDDGLDVAVTDILLTVPKETPPVGSVAIISPA